MIEIDRVKLEFLECRGDHTWRTTAPVAVRDGFTAFTIPKGFESDLASVPRCLWPVFPPYGRHLRAAIVHDWLYKEQPVARVQADAMFLAAMAAYNVSLWKRWAMYIAVRIFGWAAWKKNGAAKGAVKSGR